MAGIYSQGGSAGHRYAGWLETVEAKNFQFGGKVFNGSPSAIYVGSNLVWMGGWLSQAAQRAILGAFGQRDGWAVIKATNAYLNQLAASGQAGKDKATALAWFINEDPMMVCSLGLEVQLTVLPAMPWRMFNNPDGTCWIETGKYIPTGSSFSEVVVRGMWTNTWLSGTDAEANVICNNSINCGTMNGYKYWWFCAPWQSYSYTFREAGNADIVDDELHITPTGMYLASNPSDVKVQNKQPQNALQLDIFTRPSFESRFMFKGGVAIAGVKLDGVDLFYCIPFQSRTQGKGYLDIANGIFYPNAGTGQFTESFGYMQNGSWVTWTPSTP